MVHIMALDSDAYSRLVELALPNVEVYPIEILLDWDYDLVSVRPGRSKVEFYWTCSPSWVLYGLECVGLDEVVYLDADIYCASSPKRFVDSLEGRGIAITPHRFPPELKERYHRNGLFNFGVAYFEYTPKTMECLKEWRAQCLNWCYHSYVNDNKTTGEQGYMNVWPEKYDAMIITHPGVNLAPWNQMQYSYQYDNEAKILYVDHSYPVIFYHFHGLRIENSLLYVGGYHIDNMVLEHLYKPYFVELIRLDL